MKQFLLPLVFVTFGFTQTRSIGEAETGRQIFGQNCKRCHGMDGTRGFLGAKDLRKSVLADDAIAERVREGKRFMPAFKKKFTAVEIRELVTFVKTLRPH